MLEDSGETFFPKRGHFAGSRFGFSPLIRRNTANVRAKNDSNFLRVCGRELCEAFSQTAAGACF
jgi:hypothetical protein